MGLVTSSTTLKLNLEKALAGTFLTIAILGSSVCGQPPAAPANPARADEPLNDKLESDQLGSDQRGADELGTDELGPGQLTGEALTVYLTQQFQMLDDPNYRARVRARWSLEQRPLETIALIPKLLPQASINSVQQVIDLLDHFANRPDVMISSAAVDTLQQLATLEGTALGTMAKRCKAAIDDAKEQQATEVLQALGASIGYLPLVVNGSKNTLNGPEFALEINSEVFAGSPESYKWMRFLRSVKVVSLHGPVVSESLLTAITEMPQATKLLFKRCKLSSDELRILRTMPTIEHLEFSYVPVGDEIVPTLCELPLSESLRMFGTRITAKGEEAIAKQHDGLEIYRGAGGFLGIQSAPAGPVIVTRVEPNSAADLGGIYELDYIKEVNGVVVKDFPQLRVELAKYAASESITVLVERQAFNPENGKPVKYDKLLKVVLGALE